MIENLSSDKLVQDYTADATRKSQEVKLSDKEILRGALESIVVPVLKRHELPLKAAIDAVKSNDPVRIEAITDMLASIFLSDFGCRIYSEELPASNPAQVRVNDFGKIELAVSHDLVLADDVEKQKIYVAELIHELGFLTIVSRLIALDWKMKKDQGEVVTDYDKKMTAEKMEQYKRKIERLTSPPLTLFVDAWYEQQLRS